MKESIDHGPIFRMKQLTLKECEEYFGQPYTFIEAKGNKKEMYDMWGNIIGWIEIHNE